MKKIKWLSLLLVICMLLSSCNTLTKKTEQTTDQPEKNTKTTGIKKETETKKQTTQENQSQPTKSKINQKDIRKIEYDNIINKGVYEGFSKQQEEMLKNNGFVVMEPNIENGHIFLKMHQGYEAIEYSNASVMITTDAVLNLLHVFYSESIQALEIETFLPNLKTISQKMYEKAIEAYETAPEALDKAYTNIIAYFLVANTLLENEVEYGEAKAQELAQKELENIEAEAQTESPITDVKIDYSQFKVRGHYTRNEELSKYFKAMMWYGHMGFTFEKRGDEAVLLAKMITENPDILELWQKNYEITSLYAGQSDDVSVLEMMEALKKLKEKDLEKTLINQNSRTKFLKKLDAELPNPKIVAKLSEENKNFAQEKSFKFMGQRFNVDGYIMQNLMEPIRRPVPTVFDTFTAMGHEISEKILRENYDTNQKWEEYDTNLEKMKKEYQEGDLTNGKNIYNGWIRSIEKTLNYVPQGNTIPYFMTTPAYEYKKINAALGSYAELKHDNILYSKQAMAEMGGPEGNFTLHYLEPNVELYEELHQLMKQTEKLLEEAGLKESYTNPIKDIKETMETFVTISEKELTGKDLNKEELAKIIYFGGLVEYLSTHYLYALTNQGYDFNTPKTSALIADIATVIGRDGGVLEVATGIPYEIYVLCHQNGVDFLAKGYVFSAFEFFSEERLTDEEWIEKIGVRQKGEDGFEWATFEGENYDEIRKIHPPFYKEFFSNQKNEVTHQYEVEVNWQK